MQISIIKQKYLEKIIKFNDEAVGSIGATPTTPTQTTPVSEINIPETWSIIKNTNSSNVKRFAYSANTGLLVIEFQNGVFYTYFNVDTQSFWDFALLKARAKTYGENENGVWWKGKPSFGAGVHQYLKNRFNYVRGGII